MFGELPRELQTEAFRWTGLREYRALACCSSGLSSLSSQLKSELIVEGEGTTCFFRGTHLTEYQTAMLRHLLRYGDTAQYTCVPDAINLFIISFLYSFLTKACLTIDNTMVNFIHRLAASESLFAEIVTKVGSLQLHSFVNKFTIRVGTLELYVESPYRELDRVHPSFEQVQRYPVWCFNSNLKTSLVRDDLKCLVSKSYARYTKRDLRENDIFYVADSHASNVYAMLSQVHSTSPKMCFIYQPHQGSINSGVPLPFAYYRSFPGKQYDRQKLPVLSITEEMTYAELLSLQNSTLVRRSDEEVPESWVLVDPSLDPNAKIVARQEPHV